MFSLKKSQPVKLAVQSVIEMTFDVFFFRICIHLLVQLWSFFNLAEMTSHAVSLAQSESACRAKAIRRLWAV